MSSVLPRSDQHLALEKRRDFLSGKSLRLHSYFTLLPLQARFIVLRTSFLLWLYPSIILLCIQLPRTRIPLQPPQPQTLNPL